MTDDDFRRIALGMKDAIESSHMDHPDFRVHGRIFATLHPDLKWGMVKLTPEQQERFVADARNSFIPEKGAWGVQGCTAVRLDVVDEEILGEAMTLAWRGAREKGPVRARKAVKKPKARTR
jgi:YjbR protein